MRRLLTVLVLGWLSSATLLSGGQAQGGVQIIGAGPSPTLTAFAYEQITFLAASTPFTAGTYNPGGGVVPASQAIVLCETAGAQLRFRYDSGTPTPSAGIPLNQGDVATINGATNVAQFKGIRGGSTSPLCNITYAH